MHPSLARFLVDKVAIVPLNVSTGKILLIVYVSNFLHGKEHTK